MKINSSLFFAISILLSTSLNDNMMAFDHFNGAS